MTKNQKLFYIETYGCQMNVNDSEIIAAILARNGFMITHDPLQAHVLLFNTCAIRERAEQKALRRIDHIKRLCAAKNPAPILGVLGCMAARKKEQLAMQPIGAHIIAGPDAYRNLPVLIQQALSNPPAILTKTNPRESYEGITPLRYAANGVSAFISIMRGCDNACAYCVVPRTRGPERSRNPDDILKEAIHLYENGYREITLLGQTVDSYLFKHQDAKSTPFADLLERVAKEVPAMRVRFATSHPEDLTPDILYTIAMYENICPHIHLPVQSGSNRILAAMRRPYTREQYIKIVNQIRRIIPHVAITTDIIAGFCDESESDFQMTLQLMNEVQFDGAFLFKYSQRPGTLAANTLQDNIPEKCKTERLQQLIKLQGEHSLRAHQKDVGKELEILAEGDSRRSNQHLCGRTEQNRMVVFPRKGAHAGQYLSVRITGCTSSTLLGHIV